MKTTMLIMATMLSLSGVAAAQDPAPAATPAGKVKAEHKLCRREAMTGTMLSKPTCHTNSEWKQIDAESSKDGNDIRDSLNRSRSSQH